MWHVDLKSIKPPLNVYAKLDFHSIQLQKCVKIFVEMVIDIQANAMMETLWMVMAAMLNVILKLVFFVLPMWLLLFVIALYNLNTKSIWSSKSKMKKQRDWSFCHQQSLTCLLVCWNKILTQQITWILN